MMRVLVITGLSLSLFFAAALLLIRTQPYDDSELRALLAPSDGCDAPCFMGIHPGVTSVEEALAIIQTHEWVQDVTIETYDRATPSRPTRLHWHWRDNASPLLETERKPRSGGRLIADNGIVQYMELLTRIRAGEAWLYWGTPEKYTSLVQLGGPDSRPPKPITAIYGDIITLGWADCPYSSQYWNAPTELIIAEPDVWLEQAITHAIVTGTTPITQFVRGLSRTNCP